MASLASYFPGNRALRRKGETPVILPSEIKSKYVLFYFSASWCPPCRRFTPHLITFYNRFHELKDFEIVLVTKDESPSDFEEYYAKMPWLAVEFTDVKELSFLTLRFNLEWIPTLFLVEAETGRVVTAWAREMVESEDPDGDAFPWPHPLGSATTSPTCPLTGIAQDTSAIEATAAVSFCSARAVTWKETEGSEGALRSRPPTNHRTTALRWLCFLTLIGVWLAYGVLRRCQRRPSLTDRRE